MTKRDVDMFSAGVFVGSVLTCIFIFALAPVRL